MKNIWKYLIAIAVLTVAILAVAGCSQWDSVYDTLDGEGKTVSVRFDANGGTVSSKADAIVDVFDISDYQVNENGMVEITLLDPESDLRTGKEGGVQPTRIGYFLAGWYETREPRTDENDNPLDDYGRPIPEGDTEIPQGYTYSGRWDFENDTVEVDPNNQDLSSEVPVKTLYAAWIPYFEIEFMAENDAGDWQQIGTDGSWVPDSNEETETGATENLLTLMQIVMPVWNESTGKLDMNNVPKRSGMTFEAAYLDAEKTQPAPAVIQGPVDYENGICTAETVTIYTTWKEGEWFHIYTPRQLASNVRMDGCYVLCADLDFSKAMWPTAFTTGEFRGTIEGNGHTISNVTVTQSQIGNIIGGMFGRLSASAVIRDVTFRDVTYQLTVGSNKQGAAFGTFAGQVNTEAVLENVIFGGTLSIGAQCWPSTEYSVNLLVGSGLTDGLLPGVTHEVACVLQNPDDPAVTLGEIDELTGEVTLVFAE